LQQKNIKAFKILLEISKLNDESKLTRFLLNEFKTLLSFGDEEIFNIFDSFCTTASYSNLFEKIEWTKPEAKITFRSPYAFLSENRLV